MFSIRLNGGLKEHIQDVSSLSLEISELDELSRSMLFVNGLHPSLRPQVLNTHPTNLPDACKSALLVEQSKSFCFDYRGTHQQNSPSSPASDKIVYASSIKNNEIKDALRVEGMPTSPGTAQINLRPQTIYTNEEGACSLAKTSNRFGALSNDQENECARDLDPTAAEFRSQVTSDIHIESINYSAILGML